MTTEITQHSECFFSIRIGNIYNVHTTVTASADQVFAWISDILRIHRYRLHHLVVGIDIEWRPSFSRYQNPVALLQLCVGRRCLIFQLLYPISSPRSGGLPRRRSVHLRRRWNRGGDVERLADDLNLLVFNTVDLRELAAQRMGRDDLRRKGLASLAMEVLGVQVNKPRRVQMSDWSRYVLNLDQIKYACVDAFLSFEMGRRLFAGNF
ncbi:hypothetical protein HPP92_008737 [Vanilla planifolia]|uniref:3'-5' exonuclease domain-containing protein n=1 Tax=Vanilla planifolia TaxID=51239 RepID=A0A835RIK1_VANPL|nr:hypothetical protein HPP92_008737 [Vanilla planifolia]